VHGILQPTNSSGWMLSATRLRALARGLPLQLKHLLKSDKIITPVLAEHLQTAIGILGSRNGFFRYSGFQVRGMVSVLIIGAVSSRTRRH
jgi:hypothetical protein